MILILRHVHESFVRTNGKLFNPKKTSTETAVEFIESERNGKLTQYFDNIRAFDRFEGAKLLVHYDDLVRGLDPICEILAFLDMPFDLDGFDEAHHRQASISIYDDQHCAFTKHEPTDFSFHRNRADQAILQALDNVILSRYGGLAEKYLRDWP